MKIFKSFASTTVRIVPAAFAPVTGGASLLAVPATEKLGQKIRGKGAKSNILDKFGDVAVIGGSLYSAGSFITGGVSKLSASSLPQGARITYAPGV